MQKFFAHISRRLLLQIAAFLVVGVSVVSATILSSNDPFLFGAAQVQNCNVAVSTSGPGSIQAGSSGTFNFTATANGCSTATEASFTMGFVSGPNGSSTSGTLPSCTTTPENLSLPASGSASKTITCNVPSGTPAGSYTFSNGIVPYNHSSYGANATQLTFNVEAASQVCGGYSLSTDKSSYNFGESIQLTYTCSTGSTQVSPSLKIEMVGPNNSGTQYITTLSNVSTGSYTIPTSNFSNKTSGSWMIWACTSSDCSSGKNSISVTLNNTSSTTTTTSPSPSPTGTVGACANGATCPAGSYCSNGEKFYYPNGDITCVAWSSGGGQVSAPAGTSECSPTDTNCVAVGQTVTYSSSKWCAKGSAYYSSDKMTCVKWSDPAPAGFSSCKPGDSQCIPSGGYGPASGWCSQGMKFYQKEKDTNPNNDVYCAATPYTAPGSTYTEPTPPSGYTACSPNDTYCKSKGDTWPETNSTNYCMNSQKCTLSTGGGMCVGWSEQCPSGSKVCNATDQNCVEPGEYKDITASSYGSYGNSYWCGGTGGMMFYSSTKVYCAPKKSGTTMGMMNASDIKETLAKLGTGWGLCRSGETQCIEPGKSGPSNGWCAWYSPNSYMMPYSSSSTGSTRTCPALDDAKVEEPTKSVPTIDQPTQPEPNICPKMPEMTNCPDGQLLQHKTDRNGCSYAYCSGEGNVKPYPDMMPYPQGGDQCRMIREENRGNKYEIRRLEEVLKHLPRGEKAPAGFLESLSKAKSLYDEIEKTSAGATKEKCTDAFNQSVREKMDSLRQLMDSLRDEGQSVEVYSRCAEFGRHMNERVRMMKQDAKRARVDFTSEINAFNELISRSKEVCKSGDRFAFEDLEFERSDIESKLEDKYFEASRQAENSFVNDSVASIREGIASGRAQIAEKALEGGEKCTSLSNLFDQVDGLLKEAETTYAGGEKEQAGSILAKVESFKDVVQSAARQCGVRLHFEEGGDVEAVFYDVEQKVIDRLTETVSRKVELLFDEFSKEITTKVAKLTEKLQAQVEASLDALQALPKNNLASDKVKEAKTAIIDTVAVISTAAQKLSAAHASRLNSALEKAASKNWCGKFADSVKTVSESLKIKAENSDINTDDIGGLEQTVTAAESQNNNECYRVGVSDFKDTDTSAWYFGYFQDSTAFKGNPDGSVEPGRQTLRAEALIAIERALGLSGVEGSCALTAPARDVPAWANCAVNVGHLNGVPFTDAFNKPVLRDEVALWIDILAKGRLPVDDSPEFLQGFRDTGVCKAGTSVSKMVGNKIMTGFSGEQAGKWGCGQPLVRAELAAILGRVSELLSLVQ
jgi:hypothetical protein